MKLRYNSSRRMGRVTFLVRPGDEIDVPDDTGEQLVRADARWEPVKPARKSKAKSAKEE